MTNNNQHKLTDVVQEEFLEVAGTTDDEIPAELTTHTDLTGVGVTLIADVIAESANASALGVKDFGEAMKYVAPVAKAMNVSLEETSAALAVLADAGQRGTVAGNGLKNVLLAASKEGKSFARFIADAAKQNLSLAGAVDLVGREAAPVFLNLVANARRLPEVTQQLQNAEGAAAKMAAIMDDSAAGAVKRFQSALESIKITLGGIIAQGVRPVIEALATAFAKMDEIFQSLPRGIQTAVVALGALAAAVGPAVLAIGAFAALGPSIGVALGAMTPFVPVIAGVVAGVTAAVGVFQLFSEWLQQAHLDLGQLQIAVQNLSAFMSAVWQQILLAARPAWEALRELAFAVFDGIRDAASAFIPSFTADWSAMAAMVAADTRNIVEVINLVTGGLQFLKNVVKAASAGFIAMFGEIESASLRVQVTFAKLETYMANLWVTILGEAQRALLDLYDMITVDVAKCISILGRIVVEIDEAITDTLNALGHKSANALNGIIRLAESAANKISSVWGGETVSFGEVSFEEFTSSSRAALKDVEDSFKEVTEAGRNYIASQTGEVIDFYHGAAVAAEENLVQLQTAFDEAKRLAEQPNLNGVAESLANQAAQTQKQFEGSASAAKMTAEEAKKAAQAAKDAQRELDRLHERAKDLLMTDADRLKEEIAGWQRLLDAGRITQQEFQKLVSESQKNFSGIKEEWADVTRSMTSELQNFIRTGEFSFKNLLANMVASIAQSGIAQMVAGLGKLIANAFGGGGGSWGSIISGIGTIFGGPFASGGNPPLGKVSLVGEFGPELFVPRRNGTIIPNHALASVGGAGGPTVIQNVNLQPGVSHEELARILPQLREQTMDTLREILHSGGRNAQAFRMA